MRLYANSTGPACSVYLEGTTTHNEGRVSTPACYLLLAPRVCTLVLFISSHLVHMSSLFCCFVWDAVGECEWWMMGSV